LFTSYYFEILANHMPSPVAKGWWVPEEPRKGRKVADVSLVG